MYIGVTLEELVRRDGGDRVVWWWGAGGSVGGVRPGAVEFLGVEPFDAFIARKLHGNAGGHRHWGVDVDIDVAVDSLAGEVELLVSLDEKVSHKFQSLMVNRFYCNTSPLFIK